MKTEKILEKETLKWLERLEAKTKNIKLIDVKGAWALENIKAYISDSKYFHKKGDLVRAFEAIVYAYGIYETALHSNLIVNEGRLEKP